MRIPAIVGTLALLALGGCQPNIPAVTWVTPLSRRLDDQVIARDRARFDSVGRAFAAADVATAQQEFDRDRAVMLIGLADEAYQRNEEGRLTNALVALADEAGQRIRGQDRSRVGAKDITRTARLDLWAVLDSVAGSSSAGTARAQLVALESALLRAQFPILGGPQCKEWEAEAGRIADRLRQAPTPAVALLESPPAPVAPPVAADTTPVEKSPAPAALSGVPSRVHFALRRDHLASQTVAVLDGLVSAVAAFPDVRIVLEGHTDERGSDKYNQALSARRAESVRRFLMVRGIAKERITVRSFGKSRLESPENSAPQHARNRRVMIRYFTPDDKEIPGVGQMNDLQLEPVSRACGSSDGRCSEGADEATPGDGETP